LNEFIEKTNTLDNLLVFLYYKTATGSLLESPDEKERNQDGDIRAGGGECVVGQRPLWAVLLHSPFGFH
jgi:hypothetical protein